MLASGASEELESTCHSSLDDEVDLLQRDVWRS
jgi:hypothetical protein